MSDAIPRVRPSLIQLWPIVCFVYGCDLGKQAFTLAAQLFVVGEHLHPEQSLLGLRPEVVRPDLHSLSGFRRRLLMRTKPKVHETPPVVDQSRRIGRVCVQSFLTQLLVPCELVASLSGAPLDSQGDP
ncbi:MULTISPECIES: hypothetical protein [unclassified Streptomyces]|uniref:hypothetical protein n=1 Tax=unclassified Streptomyces TaxID=2593676 RepID=UPI0036E5D9D2